MLHIVEPTLNSFAGHCHSLVEAVTQAMPETPVTIWAGRGSQAFWSGPGTLKPYFYRTWRRLQAFWLYRKLLRSDDKILISTAGTSDFFTLDWICAKPLRARQVYLYVHWLGAKHHKTEQLRKVAIRQPELEVLTTTETVAAFFRGIGFRAKAVPYPVAVNAAPGAPSASFRRLVVAGAARMDKGFDRVVELVEDLKAHHSTLPIVIQASATHRDKHPPDVAALIDKLVHLDYACLELMTETLTPQAYRALFEGGISLQPYSAQAFQDRVSGVTLDALAAGCPIVTTAHTWLARMVDRHGAGMAAKSLSPKGLREAINAVVTDYGSFAANAARAGQVIRSEHSANAMVHALFSS